MVKAVHPALVTPVLRINTSGRVKPIRAYRPALTSSGCPAVVVESTSRKVFHLTGGLISI